MAAHCRYINGEEATPSMLVKFPVSQDTRGGLTSVLGLKLRVKEKTFSPAGDIKIKCTATIHTIYWKSNEESLQGHQDRSSFFTYDTSFWNSGIVLSTSCLVDTMQCKYNVMYVIFINFISAAHPIVSASSTIYSQTKILAVLLHFCGILNIL